MRSHLKAPELAFVILVSSFLLASSAQADSYGPLRLPLDKLTLTTMFTSNMVLQRSQKDAIWGWAKPGDSITVSFAGQSKTAIANKLTGKWMIRLDPMAASETPKTLTVTEGRQSIQVRNVLIGDVWLCSGQSNMQYPLSGWFNRTNLDPELAAANHPDIRFYHVPMIESMFAARPHRSSPANWQICTPQTAGGVSAVGYLFCNNLHRELHVPIGLIESDWGGTNIEAWISATGYKMTPALRSDNQWLKQETEKQAEYEDSDIPENAVGMINSPHSYDYGFPKNAWHPDPRQNPTTLFNGMIAPLIPYAIKGATWYQGENNVSSLDRNYFLHLEALIGGWRRLWNQGDFPFYIVQIAPFNYQPNWFSGPDKGQGDETLIWRAEEKAAETIPNCGLVSTMDIGELFNIHPADKVDVGNRLADLALAKCYHRIDIPFSGPTLSRANFDKKYEVILHFKDLFGGLKSRDGLPLTWFQVAGADGKFLPAFARIQGDTVIVSAPTIFDIKQVQFGWNCHAVPNLENKAGLPALPFAIKAKN